jgi:hypothetical protein
MQYWGYDCHPNNNKAKRKTAGQGCRARLPGKAAGQGCRARLPTRVKIRKKFSPRNDTTHLADLVGQIRGLKWSNLTF